MSGGEVGTYRFNVIDDDGIVSFLGPRHGSKMIAAACGANHRTVASLLTFVRGLDEVWGATIEHGLQQFDWALERAVPSRNPHEPFRVVDAETRHHSMCSSTLGLFVVNLRARRIVQVDNRSTALEKAGRGRVRRNGKPTRMVFRYRLPAEWDLVP